MKLTHEMIGNIKKTVEDMDLTYRFSYIGVRVQSRPFSLGQMEHVSHVWENGDDTGVELDGVCVSSINSLCKNQYHGDHVAIIGGELVEYGEDEGEMILSEAEVVAVIC